MDILYAWLDPRIRFVDRMAINAPSDVSSTVAEAPARSWWGGVREFTRRRPLGALGAAVVVVMIVVAVFAGVLAPYDPVAVDFGAMLAPALGASTGSAPTRSAAT